MWQLPNPVAFVLVQYRNESNIFLTKSQRDDSKIILQTIKMFSLALRFASSNIQNNTDIVQLEAEYLFL